MKWIEMDERLRILYNAVATAHSDGSSFGSSQEAEQKALNLMEELTKELRSQPERLEEISMLRSRKEILDKIASLKDMIEDHESNPRPDSKEVINCCNLKIVTFQWVLKEI